ncbi:MAG: CAP domain-containing protein [Hyphomicrobiales bacterium]
MHVHSDITQLRNARALIYKLLKYSAVILICIGLISSHETQAGEGYKHYVAKILSNLPAHNAKIRPDLEAYLDALASSARKRAGRAPLTSSAKLKGAARGQAADMALGNFVGHHSKSGYRFKKRFSTYAGSEFAGLHGENAARQRRGGAPNKAKAAKLFQQWMNSTRHRRNMMNRAYAYVSTGVIQKGNHLYAVQVFWEKASKKPTTNFLVIN